MTKKCILILNWALLAFAPLLIGMVAIAQDQKEPQENDMSFVVKKMAHASDLVTVAKVLDNESIWVGKRIITISKILLLRTLKGNPTEDLVIVSFFGGTVDDISQYVTNEATLQEGEIAVLFLAKQKKSQVFPKEGFRFVDHRGKIPLLRSTDRESRLENNRRLKRFMDDIERWVKKGGTS